MPNKKVTSTKKGGTKKSVKTVNKVVSETTKETPKTQNQQYLSKITSAISKKNVVRLLKDPKKTFQSYNISKGTYLKIFLAGLIILFYLNRGVLIAATVNGDPITNLEVIASMNKQFRDQTLTQLINEKLVFQEARKNHVTVTNKDIDQKIVELEKNVGGASVLDSLLKQQGQTRNSLREQLIIQLTIEKMYSKDVKVTPAAVQEFIAQNAAQLTAKDSAGQIKEATALLQQQEVSKLFSQKFQNLKQNSKIQIF